MPADIRSEVRRLATLAAPLIAAQLIHAGMPFVDTIMVARLGSAQLAGIALGAAVYMFVTILLSGVVFAVGPLVSQAYGSGEVRQAGRAAGQGLILAALLSLPAVAFMANSETFLLAIGQQPAAAQLAASYLTAAAWGFTASLLLTALRAFLEGVGDTRPILFLMLAGLLANIVLDELLMFGRLGLPALGLAGTGYATALVQTLMCLLAAAYVASRHPRFAIFAALGAVQPALLGTLVRIGVPIGLTLGFEAGLFAVVTVLMGLVGQAELAAHQVATQAATLTFMVPVGVAVATSVRVGQAVGRRDPAGARLAGQVGMGASVAIMLLSACLFWFAPHLVVAVFIDPSDPAQADAVRHATTFLRIAAMFQLFDGLQVSAAGALRGYHDTAVPMLISLVSYWLVGLVSGVTLAFGLGWGGRGLWYGLVLGLATAAVLLLARFGWRARDAVEQGILPRRAG